MEASSPRDGWICGSQHVGCERSYPVHQMLKPTKMGGMMNIGYNNRRRRDALDIPEDPIWGSNCSMVRILSCFMSLRLISLSHEDHLLEVYLIVSQMLQGWIAISKRWFRLITHGAMGLLDGVRVNVFKVVSCLCTDDRITLPHPTLLIKYKVSSIEKRFERTKNLPVDYPSHHSIVDLLFLHGSCSSLSSKAIFQRNRKKGNKDACMIRRLWSHNRANVSEIQI